MRRVRRMVLAALLGSLAATGAAGAVDGLPAQPPQEFRVVVHPENPADTLTVDELAALFLRRATRWPDDTRAVPVDQPGEAAVREAFSQEILGRSTRAVLAHWQQQIFSGRGVPPTELRDDGAVTEYVGSNRGAVGYVSPSGRLRGVKVVEVVR